MGRLLAIDYGQKRVGIAVTDPLQLIATGLKTVATEQIYSFLEEYVQTEQVEGFVVGLAKQMNNKPSESSLYIEPFVEELKKRFANIPVYRVDERFTSVIASHTIAHSGLKKKSRQNKSLIDTVSAVVILQSYLAQRDNQQQKINNSNKP